MSGAGVARPTPGGSLVAVKVVPGARKDEIAGLLGDRLKVRVSAPPEAGKANAAVCALIARSLGVKPRAVTVVDGHAYPEKTLRVEGVEPGAIASLW